MLLFSFGLSFLATFITVALFLFFEIVHIFNRLVMLLDVILRRGEELCLKRSSSSSY